MTSEDETVARVARETGVPSAALRDAVDAVQAVLAGWPGLSVDGLVYEWRQSFREDPVVARTPDRWVLALPDRAWADVRERAAVDEAVEDALLALYRSIADVSGVDVAENRVLVVAVRD